MSAVERVCEIARADFCSTAKHARIILAKETMILAGRRQGATTTALSRLLSISSASVSRRHDAAAQKLQANDTLASHLNKVVEQYEREVERES